MSVAALTASATCCHTRAFALAIQIAAVLLLQNTFSDSVSGNMQVHECFIETCNARPPIVYRFAQEYDMVVSTRECYESVRAYVESDSVISLALDTLLSDFAFLAWSRNGGRIAASGLLALLSLQHDFCRACSCKPEYEPLASPSDSDNRSSMHIVLLSSEGSL